MNIPAHYKDIPENNWVSRIPTHIESLITAVDILAQNNKGETRIRYIDRTEEEAECPEINVCDEEIAFYSIVSAVQSKRVLTSAE